ncbi:MAG: GIY-YIG nuclease family protein [Alkalibacterium sp.]|nr:GIY-YIG nuclease family protein [Alkalibacterium sp.]
MEKISAIYKITNTINGRTYVGRSKNVYKRWGRHREDAKFRRLPLYEDIRSFGIHNFAFSIIEECEPEMLDERELFYFKLINPEYNVVPPGENPMNNEFARSSYKKAYFTDEASRNRSEKLKERWANDKEYRDKMIKISSVPCSDEKKKAIAKAKKNKKRVAMHNLETREELHVFESVSEAVRYLRSSGYPKAGATPISNVCKGRWNKAYEHYWSFKETQTTIQ